MRLALAQINTHVGDIERNADKIRERIAAARGEGCDVVLFPELTLTGYPGQDLYLQPHFSNAAAHALEAIAAETAGITALIGFPEVVPGADRGPSGHRDRPSAHNSLAVVAGGRVRAVHRKRRLPSYGVFDEDRQFLPGNEPLVTTACDAGIPVGVTICEDCWDGGAVAREEVAGGAELILNASASPWYRGRGPEREAVFSDLARSIARPIAMCNQVGGEDGLVFDGSSFVVSATGEILARAASFEEDLLICRLDASDRPDPPPSPTGLAEVRRGLVLGLRDYLEKNGFSGVVLGLSGGIDSALVAALSVEALGPERVTCMVMPSPHSGDATQDDARQIARNLGARLLDLPIAEAMSAYDTILTEVAEPAGRSSAAATALENIQARIRGNLVMAISNREGLLPLSCGNKSEASVGYATLYGDMAGGLAPIKDVAKMLVYELAEDYNRTGIDGVDRVAEIIPATVIARPPTAELRPGQRDSDSLPPYPELDRALEAHVERDLGRAEMIAEGIKEETVDRVIALVRGSEHKRRQSAPGIRITPKALDRDRRVPITNGYRSDGS